VADWATISSLATAGGTMILAVATFASVRSANRSARTAERAVQIGLRPVLMASHLQDPPEKLRWPEGRWTVVRGGRASIEEEDGVIFLAMSLRNSGAGIAVLQAWRARPGVTPLQEFPDLDHFRRQRRDIYVAPGDTNFWQGAIRDPSEADYSDLHDSVTERQPMTIDLLYSDGEGGQRTVSRFALAPGPEADWLASVARHFNLDRAETR
jgi:hypothetical protein